MMSNVLFAGDIRGTTDFYYWYVKSKTGEVSNDDWKFIHRYSLGWRKKLTSTIDLSADIRATLSNTEDRDSSDLSPTFLLRMSNDIFSSNIGYRSTDVDPEEGDNTSSKIYSLDFISNLEDIPGLRGSYNKSENFTAGDITTQSSNLNLTSGYGYSFFDLKYDYTRNHSRDFRSEVARETDSHFGTIDMSESFLKNKINLSGRYGIIYSGIKNFSETKTMFPEETGITRARFNAGLSTIFANMADVFYLLDNDKALSGSPTINIKNNNQNIGFDLGEVQRIHEIYLYVIPGSTPISVKTNWGAVDWYLYSATTENSTWDIVPDGTNGNGISSVTFDPVNNRFAISVAKPEARYLKIVNKDPITTNDIYITEIEVLSYLSDTETTQLKSTMLKHDVSFNANFQPIERVKMSYNLFYETYEREPSSRTVFQLLQGANLSTTLHKYLSSFISYQTLLQHNATVKTGLDSYSLQFTSSPLETLKTSLTLNRSESTEESRIESRGDSATFSIFSNLYYGVDLDVDFLISDYKDFSSGTKTTTKSINTDITLELTRKIRVTTYGTITWQSGVVTNNNTYIFRPTVNYRISESLYLTISEDLRGNGDFEVGSNFNANWRASQDLQFILGYNRWDGGDTTSENVNSTISWNISRSLVLRLQYNRAVQENDTKSKTDTFTTRLTTRF
ncbi:MAG: hypothetical protein ACC630_07925 [Nitrospinota bacterium]